MENHDYLTIINYLCTTLRPITLLTSHDRRVGGIKGRERVGRSSRGVVHLKKTLSRSFLAVFNLFLEQCEPHVCSILEGKYDNETGGKVCVENPLYMMFVELCRSECRIV